MRRFRCFFRYFSLAAALSLVPALAPRLASSAQIERTRGEQSLDRLGGAQDSVITIAAGKLIDGRGGVTANWLGIAPELVVWDRSG